MKTMRLLGTVFLFLCMMSFVSCSDDETGRKITDQKEYEMTVASELLPGVMNDGHNILTEVFAVKKDHASEWTGLGGIQDFEFEEGYEYRIRVNETSFLDEQMGDPAWTEYKLLEVLSKEKKNSENLPEHFIPKWFYKENKWQPEYRFAVDAVHKDVIEKDLKENPPILATNYFLLYHRAEKWIAIDSNDKVIGKGYLKREHASFEDFPQSYQILPLKSVRGTMRWTFINKPEYALNLEPFDVILATGQITKSVDLTPDPWFYKDMTDYYKTKYPEAGVKAVVYSVGIPFVFIE